MRRIWLGFAWILFGILLVLVGFEPPALTILSWMRAYWAPVVCSVGSSVWCWCFWTTRTKIDRGDVVYADFSRH